MNITKISFRHLPNISELIKIRTIADLYRYTRVLMILTASLNNYALKRNNFGCCWVKVWFYYAYGTLREHAEALQTQRVRVWEMEFSTFIPQFTNA